MGERALNYYCVMKVLNLKCQHGHGFEGWFAGEEDFTNQLGRGLLECPICGDTQIAKMPSAPRLNLSASSGVESQGPQTMQVAAGVPEAAELQRLYLQAVRQMMASTEDVGPRFAEEARRMHYGEAEHKGIRGQATREEAAALREEGIDFMSMPVPDALKIPLQ
jgi:hypothetical protein